MDAGYSCLQSEMAGRLKTGWGCLLDWRRRVWGFNEYGRRQWVAALAERIPPGARILDVGAGIGQYRGLFAHCEYRAHDFGAEPATIGKYAPLDYESDITEIPVPDSAFDVILCTEVLEHVPEPIKAIREMARILRPGGRLLLTAPLGSFLHQEPYHFYGGYTPHWYRTFLPAAGLDIASLEPNRGFFSLFGQEARRFVQFLNPRATNHVGPLQRAGVCLLWLLMFAPAQILPLLGHWLDGLELEGMATVGYHVIAVKRDGTP